MFIEKDFYKSFQIIVTVLTLASAAYAVVMMYINPLFVDTLAFEDGPVEYFSALFLATSALLVIIQAFRFIRKRHWTLTIGLICMGLLFSFICMEEISWGQRIFNIESPEFFLENNIQAETNLHNLHTGLSEMIYYSGAFLLFVILPFLRNPINSILKRFTSVNLPMLLPASWLIVPFAITSGFSGSGRMVDGYVFTTFATTLVILGIVMLQQQNLMKYTPRLIAILVTIILVCLAMYVSNYTSLISGEIRTWALTEWKELFIAFGILSYTVSLFVTETNSQRERA